MKRVLEQAITVVLATSALVLTGMVVWDRYLAPPTSMRDSIKVPNWEDLAEVGHALGSRDSPIKVVEFADFQCPACRAAHTVLKTLLAENDDVVLIYRHFPIETLHPHAFAAALAAECAAAQEAFEPFYHVAYERQTELGTIAWDELASQAGVQDLDAFADCVLGLRARRVVERDLEDAEKIGVSGTPTFVVNGRAFSGTPGVAEWRQIVEAAR